jgi:DNA-directed RNA polymerase specialized sigma24 family protein
MMTIQELIECCARNEGRAWAELWLIVEGSALCPIRRLLARWHFDPSLEDDIMQELYRYLQADGQRRLRSFRGASEPELRSYLRTLATRFGRDTIRKWDGHRRREARTLRLAPPPDRAGPTEQEIQAAIRELNSILSASDRAKLKKVLSAQQLLPEPENTDPLAAPEPSPRTVRHWRQQIGRLCGRDLS